MRLLLKYCILTLDSCLSSADFNVSNHGLPAPALHCTRRVALWGRPARVPTATVESAAGWAGLGSMRQCCNRMSGPSGEVFGEQIVQDVGWLIMSVNFGELAINPSSWIPMPRCYAGPVRLVRKFLIPPRHGKVSEICKASRKFQSSIMEVTRFRNAEGAKAPKPSKTTNYTILITCSSPAIYCLPDLYTKTRLCQWQPNPNDLCQVCQCPRVRKPIGVPLPTTGDPQFVVSLILGHYFGCFRVFAKCPKQNDAKRL